MSISFIINRDLLLKLNILISGYFYEIYKYNTILLWIIVFIKFEYYFAYYFIFHFVYQKILKTFYI